jgi:putative membrane-bound dehydrogenase-like protein
MHFRRGLLIAVLCLSLHAPARGADPTDTLDVPAGLEVKLWAQTPQLFNPTNIDVDAHGRIWVAEGVNYRETWKQQRALKHPDGDRIVILQDTDGDGVCDSSNVFVEDKDLLCPLGIAVIGNQIIVSCSPNLIVYTDTDGDDKPDKKEILLTGFGGRDHDHGLHSVTGGLDGKWYFNVGNDGPHEVTDRSGWHLHSGSCYVYGPTGNTGNRKSDDGRVWTGGIAFRVDPDGKHLVPLAHNFRNSYEIARDSFGNLWQSDNDDDGNRGCRFSWLMEGANMGYFSADGTRAWRADMRPGQEILTAHWHQDDPGVVPIQDNTGAGGPTGVVAYEGGLLPKEYVGCLFDADAGRNCVWIHKPVADGAGFHFERSMLVHTKPAPTTDPADRTNWFRPSDVAIGTDGAIYVADWYDPGVGGHDIKDKAAEGRIFRIAPRGDRTPPPKIDLDSFEGQLAALNNPAVNIRHVAANKLADAGESAVPKLLAAFTTGDPIKRARLIWVLSRCGDIGVQAVGRMFRQGDEPTRLTAFRALRAVSPDVVPLAESAAQDPSPAVRREVAIALRDVPWEKCRDIVIKLAAGFDGRDRFYLEALGIACEGKEQQAYPALMGTFAATADRLNVYPAAAALAWRLHPPEALDELAARARSTSVSADERRRAVDAIAFIHEERAAAAMVKLIDDGPKDVRELARWWAKNRAGNDWKSYAAVQRFVATATSQATVAATQRAADREAILDTSLPLLRRQRAAGRLAADPQGAVILFALASEGKFPAQLRDTVTDRLTRNPDLGVRALAGEYFPRQTITGHALPPVKQLASMKGDATRGKAVFFGNAAACSRCHRFDGEGKDIGPDLTSIRTKYARLELLDNILNPSANIAFGYEPWIVKTKGGDVFCGFILADGESVVIKESSGEQRTIPRNQVVLRKKQPMSIMPDNVALGLSAQDLADLSEYLLNAPVKK